MTKRGARPYTIADYRQAYRSGSLNPAGAVEDLHSRLALHADPAAFISLRSLSDLREEARAITMRVSPESPLFGIPIAVKDNIDVAGLPTTLACPDFAYRPQRDATAVARLREAGAIIVGKANLDQFATGLVGVRSPYGVPRNPMRADLAPGGSSSGSATLVSAGLVPAALGTDTAGSGRIPAGLTNIVGLKPSLGMVSTYGVAPACRSLDCVSVFALDVADAYTVLDAIAGYDESDPFSRRFESPRRGALAPHARLAVPDAASRRFAGDRQAAAAFDLTLERAIALGAEPIVVDMSNFFAAGALLYGGSWIAERYQSVRDFVEKSPGAVLPITRSIIRQGAQASAADAFADFHRLAELRRAVEPLWREVDCLIVPTFPRPRTLAEIDADPLGVNAELGVYSCFVNLLDLCAVAVPGSLRPDGAPSSVTLIAPAGCEARLAPLAAALHAAADVSLGATGRALSAELPFDNRACGDEIEIIVFGAHLSGLSLNRELTARGGRFLRPVATAPDYRMFLLADAPPRPGLLRVEEGAGAAIEGEAWALAPQAFGSFVAAVPEPLNIGAIRLADGERRKGFLVERQATKTAQEITQFGGWRNFLKDKGSRTQP